MMTTKTHNYECCMCGDHGLSYELFRCKVCHFRSQHRYCSNLYPKAESYRVCNWCLIQKDIHHQIEDIETSASGTPSNNSNYPCSQNNNPTKATTNKSNHHINEPKMAGAGAKRVHPSSPIKKLARSSKGGSSLSQKKFNGQNQDQKKLRKTRSNQISNSKNKSSRGGGGGPAVIKYVIRNKVRRYKLLDEVSS